MLPEGPQSPPPDVPAPIDLLPVSARYVGGAEAGPHAHEHVVAAKNRWSRVILGFAGLEAGRWYALEAILAWDPAEAATHALDFALIGFDVLTADGSSLDVEQVPGLARTHLDPHGAWIAGPAFQPPGSAGGCTAPLRLAFRMPSPACGLTVGVRSWRNTAPFAIRGLVLRPGEADPPAPLDRPRRLGPAPDPLRHALVPGIGLVLRGQLFAERPNEHAARVGIAYRDRAGAPIPPPYPGTVSVPALGALVNLPAHAQGRRFTLDLRPPPEAAALDLAFGTWEEAGEVLPRVELVAAVEVALEDALRLESLCGDDLLAAPDFLARLRDALGLDEGAETEWLGPGTGEMAPTFAPILARIRALQLGAERGALSAPDGGHCLRLAGAPDWPRPAAPAWREDPCRAGPWRLAYQSLSWLPALPDAEACARAAAWSGANPWGQPADPLSLHPAALPARTEILVGLALRAAEADLEAHIAAILLGEGVRHGFALAEIVGQNTFGRSLHGLQAAAALLVLARALPRLPLAAYWGSLARESLRQGFAALLGPEGRFAEASLHRRFELLGLGRVLAETLGAEAPGPDIAARVEAALPGLAGLLDPGGRLPPLGDSPHGIDQAGWIGRLLALRPRALVAERGGEPLEAPAPPDMRAVRHDAPGRGWAQFACTFAEQAPAGHLDCTSFVFATGGLRWIVEGGGSEQSETGAARHYLLSARAHNVAIPDGREPMAGRGRQQGDLALDGATAQAIATNVHGPDYRHVRIFVLLDDLDGLAVIDRFETAERPVTFEGLLHLAPEAVVALAGPRRGLAQIGDRRLGLIPWTVAGQAAGLEIVNGRNDRPGALQGFVARAPGPLQPAGVLRYAFAGRGTVCGGLLVSADADAEERLAALLRTERLGRFIAGG